MPKQPVRVQIFNQSYSLLVDGDPHEVQEIAQRVDELVATIASHNMSVDSTRVAVLACLHLADKLRTAEKQLQQVQDRSGRIAALLENTLLEETLLEAE
jgi:cell division protein ZapA